MSGRTVVELNSIGVSFEPDNPTQLIQVFDIAQKAYAALQQQLTRLYYEKKLLAQKQKPGVTTIKTNENKIRQTEQEAASVLNDRTIVFNAMTALINANNPESPRLVAVLQREGILSAPVSSAAFEIRGPVSMPGAFSFPISLSDASDVLASASKGLNLPLKSDSLPFVDKVSLVLGIAHSILDVAKPLLTKQPSVKDTKAFERRMNAYDPPGPKSSFLQVMTSNAIAYLGLQDEKDQDASTKNLRDADLMVFHKKKEAASEKKRTTTTSGDLTCTSQRSDLTASMVVGGVDEPQWIHLWENETVLKWAMIGDSFRTGEEAEGVETSMVAATSAWNTIAPGGVKFQMTSNEEDAHFVVVFRDETSSTFAVAFFPAEYIRGYSRVNVYGSAVQTENIGHLGNVLCHELGHVLGFRHSFALEKERSQLAGLYGQEDPKSVMSYQFVPMIDVQDCYSSRQVYKHFQGQGAFDLSDGRGKKVKFYVKRISA